VLSVMQAWTAPYQFGCLLSVSQHCQVISCMTH
jgi:hypothetical protein